MANATQRSISTIETVVLNGPSTPAQRLEVLDLYRPYAPHGATTEEVAKVFISDVRDYILGKLKANRHVASKVTTSAQVDTDFPELP